MQASPRARDMTTDNNGGLRIVKERKHSKAVAFLPAALAFIGMVAPMAGGSITLTYAGNETTQCVYGTCPGDLLTDALNLSVTLITPLGNGLNNQNELSNISAWTLTDSSGYIDFSSTTEGNLTVANFSTNASGAVVPIFNFVVLGSGWPSLSNTAAASVNSSGDDVAISDASGNLSESQAYYEGQWSGTQASGSQAPEPSSLLMAAGAGMALVLRRKHRLASLPVAAILVAGCGAPHASTIASISGADPFGFAGSFLVQGWNETTGCTT